MYARLEPAFRREGVRAAEAVGLAAAVALLWLVFAPRTADLAAQVYRADLFRAHGWVLYDPSWYAGHDVPAYSLVFPPLGALLGTRVVGALAAVLAALCFERIVSPQARWAVRWFALTVVCDLLIGRVTYTCGVALGLAAVLAWQRGRPAGACALAVLCALASPIAGLFLALAAVAIALDQRRPAALAMALAPLAAVGLLQVAFPEGGRQPFAAGIVIALLVFALAGALLLPARLRAARIGCGLYLTAILGSLVVASPMGSNIERLGTTLFVPVFLAGAAATSSARRRAALVALAAAAAVFQWAAPVHELTRAADNPAVTSRYYEPLLKFLSTRRPWLGRVEVPFTAMHWESEALAPHVALARGWERQLDTRYNALFYDPAGVGVERYRRWLQTEAVRYVALPDVELDAAGQQEARLIATHPSYLRPVWRSSHWRVFAVLRPSPLLVGPASLLSIGPDRVTLRAHRAGPLRLALHWTSLWHVSAAGACVTRSPDGFTTLHTAHAQIVSLTTRITAAGVLGATRTCAAVG